MAEMTLPVWLFFVAVYGSLLVGVAIVLLVELVLRRPQRVKEPRPSPILQKDVAPAPQVSKKADSVITITKKPAPAPAPVKVASAVEPLQSPVTTELPLAPSTPPPATVTRYPIYQYFVDGNPTPVPSLKEVALIVAPDLITKRKRNVSWADIMTYAPDRVRRVEIPREEIR